MALAIRQEFDEKKNESNPITIQKYIKEAEEELDEWRHPDPYNQPHFIGGSKWERNLPPPPEVNGNHIERNTGRSIGISRPCDKEYRTRVELRFYTDERVIG